MNDVPEIPEIPEIPASASLQDVIKVINLQSKTLEMMTKTMQKLADLVEIHDKFWKAFSKLAKEGKS